VNIQVAEVLTNSLRPGSETFAHLTLSWQTFFELKPTLHNYSALISSDVGRATLNSILVSGLIMATVPLLSVLLLGQYHFPAWQYGLAFGIPALGGFVGARLSARLVTRYGRHRVMAVSGWLRSLFPLGLTFVRPGIPGLLTVIIVEGLLITCMGIFNPINATERLQRTPADHAAQVLTAWNVSSKLAQAVLMVVWGILATITSPLTAITISGILLLATPLLLPNRTHMPDAEPAASTEDLPAA